MKKKIFSKVFSMAIAVAMMGSLLAGCGSSEETTTESAPATEAETEADAAADSDAPACKDALKGVSLVIGTSGTYAPFSFFESDGTTLTGYDVEMLKALQDILGFEIADDKIQDMDYQPLGTALGQGQLDLGAAALCATDERKKSMNFSKTYYDAGLKVIVAEDNDKITGVDDLKTGDYTVAVQSGTLAYEYATGEGAFPESCLQVFDSQALAYKAVEDGQADATIYDVPGTAYSISTGEIHLKMVGDEFYNGQAPYAIAFSFAACEKYPEIIDDFNAAIDYLTENGTMDELKAKWCE